MNNTNQILIEKYIEGSLTAQELADFELKLKSDAGFAKELSELQDFVMATQAFGRNQLKEELNAIALAEPLSPDIFSDQTKKETSGTNEKSRRLGFSSRRLMSIAAAVILITTPIVLLVNGQKAQPKELFSSYFEAYLNVAAPIVRDGSSKTPLGQALAAYEQKDYKSAIRQLRKVRVAAKEKEAVMFYLAMSYLAHGNAPEAIKRFEKLQSQTLYLYKEQTSWYLALALLANNDIDNCKKALKKLADQNGFYQEKASELLDKL